MIYLDHAATAPVLRPAAEAMYEVLTEHFANPSAQYRAGREMKKRLDGWREAVAAALGSPPDRLAFTSCGTEGDVWAMTAACWQNRHKGRHIVTTAVEHSAVLERCRQLEQEGWTVTRIPPRPDGSISAGDVLDAVTGETALVSVMLVNNELGNRYPVEEIAQGLAARNPDALLHTDAVQGFLKVPFRASSLGADLVTVSAHKIGGPKGIGALYLGPRMKNPRPLLPGGGQEHGFRSGTEATAQIAGFAKAAEARLASLPDTLARLERLRALAVEELSAIEDLVLLGPAGASSGGTGGTSSGGSVGAASSNGEKAPVPYAPHILAFSLSGWPSQNVINDLSEQGICLSAGSACHRGRPSHVTAALRLPKRTERGVLRMSFGPETTEDDIRACAAALRRHHDTRLPML
ncbi:MAG: cysteine desulfurase [Oscillibacter sp.]|nr:cysteine desulfurase [Oscillibacter sp.]